MFSSLRRKAPAVALVAGMTLAAVSSQRVFAQTPDPTTVSPASSDTPIDVCGPARPGDFRCESQILPGARTKRMAITTPDGAKNLPAGYGPQDLRSAYRLAPAMAAGAGKGKTIAIVDAQDDPTAEADLAVYRSTYGLPPCTTASGCFRKVNQNGQASPLPTPNNGWSVEISLDLDAVSAICPACNILLVEANAPSFNDLPVAVDTAVALGADAVSNSYDAPESGQSVDYARHYDHPGVAITAASGDAGYQLSASFPADLTTVTAVGGTSLTRASNARGWSETAWAIDAKGDGAGSSCSAWVDKPAWQRDRACPGRTVADVSAVADPHTGLAVYDTTPPPPGIPTGWSIIGGTSAATPIIAGVYALAGHTGKVRDASGLYAHRVGLNDVAGGNNAQPGVGHDCPTTSYICTAVRGYDAPTGLGTPDGLAAF